MGDLRAATAGGGGGGSEEGWSELVILGSGSSTGVPTPSCILRPTEPPCAVCHKALFAAPPEANRDYRHVWSFEHRLLLSWQWGRRRLLLIESRCNPSMLVDYVGGGGGRRARILVDAGKNFKEQVLRWFPPYGIRSIDALLLTHEHADAILGLDDVRGVQPWDAHNNIPPMPVFLTQHSMDSVKEKFPYLVKKPLAVGQEVRRVAQLDWRVIDASVAAPFYVDGLTVTPLPVMHGEDYVCLGFLFGAARQRIAYISDVSRIPPETDAVLQPAASGSPLDILILDCLFKKRASHNTHLCYPQSLEVIKRLRPKKALLIGMTHEFDHVEVSAELDVWSASHGIDVKLSHDGMRIPVYL
eukprot:SM000056S17969  [mRNA]  locus=s56:337086:340299:- [translate_table: standard]